MSEDPKDGMDDDIGDDEELQIGGTVATLRTDGPLITSTTQEV